MGICGDRSSFGASFKWPFEELQFLAVVRWVHVPDPEVARAECMLGFELGHHFDSQLCGSNYSKSYINTRFNCTKSVTIYIYCLKS